MKKVVLKLDFLDEKTKRKIMKNVSHLAGVDSISMDMKDKKLTVTGDVDAVTIVSKLRKICYTDIVSVGPAKEPEKKKDDGADKKKEEEKKKADEKKKEEALRAYYLQQQLQQQQQQYLYYNYQQQQPQPYYYNHQPTPYYSKPVQDETPNCVIC